MKTCVELATGLRNKLLINSDKTKLVIFGSGAICIVSKLEAFRLTLLGKEIRPVASAKDLEVLLDSNLTYNDVCLSVCLSVCMYMHYLPQQFH